MDFDSLRKQAIEATQKVSGDNWTDYNFHDPGVTILEQFVYAVTDISYRTNLPIEKILFHGGDVEGVLTSNALYQPQDVFTCSAVTASDFRILLLDNFPELLSNVWVSPIKNHKDGFIGLYELKVIFSERLDEEGKLKGIKKLKKFFAAHRNLGEDLEEVLELQGSNLSFKGELELSHDVNAEEVYAEILYQVENYINPKVRFYNLSEMKEMGYSLDEIYDTPSCGHGFILETELYPRQKEFHVSKIADFVTGIDGVRNLSDFQVSINNVPIYGDTIQIEEGTYLTLGLDYKVEELQRFGLKFIKGGMNNPIINSSVLYYWNLKEARSQKSYETTSDRKVKIEAPVQTNDLKNYLSVQYSFPDIYKVGDYEPHSKSEPGELIKSKQLQGYLLFFDQLMANHLSQLVNINKLFSIDDLNAESYFTQSIINDVPGADELLGDLSSEQLKEIANSPESSDRKNKVLSHLLARFGERFTTDFHLRFNEVNEGGDSSEANKKLVELKSLFLKEITHLNRYRSLGMNYLACYEESVPISLKRKVSLLLNISSENTKLTSLDLSKKLKKKKLKSEDIKKNLSSDEQYFNQEIKEEKINFVVNSKSVFKYLFRYGLKDKNYKLIKDGDKTLLLFSSPDDSERYKIGEFGSKKEALEKLKKLVAYLKQLNDEGEGFHIIDHVLFRPRSENSSYFYLYSDQNEKLFKSLVDQSQEKQQQIAFDTVLLGCYEVNYEILKNNRDKFVVFIKNQTGKQVCKSAIELEKLFHAERLVKECVKLFSSHKEKDTIDSVFKIGSQKQYTFNILNGKNQAVFDSAKQDDIRLQEEKVLEVGVLGRSFDNYEVERLAANKFRVVLKDYSKDVLVVSHKYYNTESEAENFIKWSVEFCEDHRISATFQNTAVYTSDESYDINDYNSQLSIVYPNWTSRFQNEEFLQVFSKTVFNCAPAHLGINMIGLPFDKMKNFESKYFKYLEELRDENLENHQSLFQLGTDVLNMLKIHIA